MRPGGGKNKGSSFERVVCRMLTTWIAGKTYPEIFWRSASSGGKATQDIKAGRKTNMHADIKAIEPEGAWLTDVFMIECKSYKKFNWRGLVWDGKGELYEFWLKLSCDARIHKKLPMLIFKENGSPVFMFLDPVGAELFNINKPAFRTVVETSVTSIRMFDFKWFCEKVCPVEVRYNAE